ncbi:MAG: threonine-phosphate decarboxylase CobD [Magnetospirillum sp.]|nr:threonine-phosphate decarboxylase CobD [Magnetospirillum sp.]
MSTHFHAARHESRPSPRTPAATPLPAHGGDLAAAEARWGRPGRGWLDLSTGINPIPYPVPPFAPETWARLPGSAEEHGLRHAAARRYGAPSPEAVVAAPGTSAVIRALPRLRAPCRVAVVGPTYGEHAPAWATMGHDVYEVSSLDAVGRADVVVVVNPNNPDGRIVPRGPLEALADRLAAKGGLLVVDEAFADCTPAASVLPGLRPGLMVLRSFGKFYGLAGLRLGFALGLPETMAPLAEALGPWAVAGPALAIGTRALEDIGWAAAALARLENMAWRLDGVLADRNLEVVGGTPLFRLARHRDARAVWERLGRAGILARAFADDPHLLRFGLPADDIALGRLAQALA